MGNERQRKAIDGLREQVVLGCGREKVSQDLFNKINDPRLQFLEVLDIQRTFSKGNTCIQRLKTR
jgi:hypothetical protein